MNAPQPRPLESFGARWSPLEVGGGVVQPDGDSLHLRLPGAAGDSYANAQIDDYAGLKRHDFPWRPPLRLTVRAQAVPGGEGLRGTAGFGFWNAPFDPAHWTLPRPPRAAWFFFGSPPNNTPLALGQPGHGWKAATFDAQRTLFWALLPAAPLGFLLMRSPALYRRLWPLGQRALGVDEAHLDPGVLATPHEYGLHWRQNGVTFTLDGEVILATPRSPRGPLGFVAWLDNQYAVVTPQGRFGWGVLACGDQRLTLAQVAIAAA